MNLALSIKGRRNQVPAGTQKKQFSFYTGTPVNKYKIMLSIPTSRAYLYASLNYFPKQLFVSPFALHPIINLKGLFGKLRHWSNKVHRIQVYASRNCINGFFLYLIHQSFWYTGLVPY